MTAVRTYDEARAIVRSFASPRRVEHVSTWQPVHRRAYLAHDIFAPIRLPHFTRAMMDGFAVHEADLNTTSPLVIAGDIRAGDAQLPKLRPGTAIQIRTGAPVPTDTAAVVRKEWTTWTDADHIRLLHAVKMGESIQAAGDDISEGSLVLRKGTPWSGSAQALLRAVGIAHAPVFAQPSVAVFSTGSELLANTEGQLPFGKIYAQSDAFLVDTLTRDGACVIDSKLLPDTLAQITEAISSMVNRVDYLLVTGGASVGDTDFVKTALRSVAGEVELPIERVWMRPGAPFLAVKVKETTIIGLSGNPTACFVQFHTLVRQAVLDTLGADEKPQFINAELSHDIHVQDIKHTRFYRGQLTATNGRLTVFAHSHQSTGNIANLPMTNALIRLDKPVYKAGEQVKTLPIDRFY